jgi:hypothetical protein
MFIRTCQQRISSTRTIVFLSVRSPRWPSDRSKHGEIRVRIDSPSHARVGLVEELWVTGGIFVLIMDFRKLFEYMRGVRNIRRFRPSLRIHKNRLDLLFQNARKKNVSGLSCYSRRTFLDAAEFRGYLT